MKLILATVGSDLDSTLDNHFGTAAFFIVVNSDTMAFQAFPNPGAPTAHAAGTRAAILTCKQKPDAVISHDYGPYCYIGLEAAGIPMYLCRSCQTAREAILAFKAGRLMQASGAHVTDVAE